MTKKLFANPIHIEGNVLFVSDAHLGAPGKYDSLQREELLIQLLAQQEDNINHLFLLGDIFDYWFEYRYVVPKGYFRFFNTLYNLHQKGVKIYYFTGNHDMWVKDYFEESFGCQVFHQQQSFVINGKRCLLGHGDGLGGKQCRYLFIKWLFNFAPCRFLYGMLHPRQSFAIAHYCSKTSRKSHHPSMFNFLFEKEHQVQYARETLEREEVDFFIYGHRHVPQRYTLTDRSTFFNTGDWLTNFSYLTFLKGDAEPALHYYLQTTSCNKEN